MNFKGLGEILYEGKAVVTLNFRDRGRGESPCYEHWPGGWEFTFNQQVTLLTIFRIDVSTIR